MELEIEIQTAKLLLWRHRLSLSDVKLHLFVCPCALTGYLLGIGVSLQKYMFMLGHLRAAA